MNQNEFESKVENFTKEYIDLCKKYKLCVNYRSDYMYDDFTICSIVSDHWTYGEGISPGELNEN